MAYERFSEAAYRPVGYRLIRYSFEELEFLPGWMASGTAHFDVDRFGAWTADRIKLDGYHGPDGEVDQKLTGKDAVVFQMIEEALRATRSDKIPGGCLEEV